MDIQTHALQCLKLKMHYIRHYRNEKISELQTQ